MIHQEDDWFVCDECGERTRLLTVDAFLYEDLRWRFERYHRRCEEQKRRIN